MKRPSARKPAKPYTKREVYSFRLPAGVTREDLERAAALEAERIGYDVTPAGLVARLVAVGVKGILEGKR